MLAGMWIYALILSNHYLYFSEWRTFSNDKGKLMTKTISTHYTVYIVSLDYSINRFENMQVLIAL